VASTRKLRKELTYEVAKLRDLQQQFDSFLDDPTATKALAKQIREQAETCLALLNQYQSSPPGRMWSDAEMRCQPLRWDLKQTEMHFRVASGEWERRTGENA
jgi:hypothetical protein